MTLEAKLLELLRGSPLGSATTLGTRFYPVIAPEAAPKPYCVYTQISRAPHATHDQNPLTTRQWVYQFSVYATTDAAAAAGLSSILAVLGDYHDGEDSDGIQSVQQIAQRQGWEEETDLYSRSADLEIWEGLT